MEHVQFAVIGAGQAGLAAAEAIAARQGQVALLDRRERPGGRGTAVDVPPKVTFWGGAFVWGLFADGVLAYQRAGRSQLLQAERIVLATGARVSLAAFPGWEHPAVWPLSRLWDRVDAGQVAGRRLAVYAGVPAALPALAAALQAGAIAAAVAGPHGDRTQAQPLSAEGRAGGLDVVWSDGPPTTCDALVVASGEVQRGELARQAGCALAYSEGAQDWLVATDEDFRTSVPSVFFVPPGSAGGAAGALAGVGAFRSLFPHSETADLRDLANLRSALAAAGGALAPDPGPTWFAPPTVLCPCEGVTAHSARAAGAGLREMNRWKRATRVGAGMCQGRFCRRVAACFLGQETGMDTSQIPPGSCRPPIWPLPLASVAAIRQPLDP